MTTVGRVYYQVEMEDLTRIEKALGMAKDKTTMVLRTAINDSAKELRLRLVKHAKEDYAYKSKQEINMASKIERKATVGNLSADLVVTGKIGELYKFNVSPRKIAVPKGQPYNPPKRYAGRVKRSSSRKMLALDPGGKDRYKGFVVKYHSGHITVAERVPGTQMRSNPDKEQLTTLYSPSIPKMEEVMYRQYEEANMEQLLVDNIQAQIIRYLG